MLIEKIVGDGMTIGELKHRVIFQRFITTINDNGFEAETWEDYKTVWASVSNLSGREFYQAAAIKAEKTVRFLIRYIDGVDNSMKILFEGKQYNIISIYNIKYENKYIEIKALEVENSS